MSMEMQTTSYGAAARIGHTKADGAQFIEFLGPNVVKFRRELGITGDARVAFRPVKLEGHILTFVIYSDQDPKAEFAQVPQPDRNSWNRVYLKGHSSDCFPRNSDLFVVPDYAFCINPMVRKDDGFTAIMFAIDLEACFRRGNKSKTISETRSAPGRVENRKTARAILASDLTDAQKENISAYLKRDCLSESQKRHTNWVTIEKILEAVSREVELDFAQ